MPLPMVLATAVPRKNAARKLKAAAQATANLGESTRVETTVAMLFAESWKPFRKSKISATMTVIKTRRRSLFNWIVSRALSLGSGLWMQIHEVLRDKADNICHTNAALSPHFDNLRTLKDDGFDDVGCVFGFVRRVLQNFIKFF